MSFIDSFRELFVGEGRAPAQKSMPLLPYCHERHFDLFERLRLFDEICDVVQSHHQRGLFFYTIETTSVEVIECNGTRTLEIRSDTFESGSRVAPPTRVLSGIHVAEAANLWHLGQILRRMLVDLAPLPTVLHEIIDHSTACARTRTRNVQELREQVRRYVHERVWVEPEETSVDWATRPERKLTPLPI